MGLHRTHLILLGYKFPLGTDVVTVGNLDINGMPTHAEEEWHEGFNSVELQQRLDHVDRHGDGP